MAIKFGEIAINDITRKHIDDCLSTNYVTMGPKTFELEDKWGQLCDYRFVVAVNSGTSACMAANMALYDYGAKPNDEVIVPALSFIATANAVRAAGLCPVFCDIRKETLLIDETKIENLITTKTRAICPVSLMGKPCKMDIIRDIAKKYNLKVIIDNCEGHGCRYQGKYMSHWADMVVYSCYAAHILFSGEFGFVCTNDENLCNILKSIRSHGREPNSLYFSHSRFGLNFKPTDLHACIGLGNIGEFQTIFDKRYANVERLKTGLAHLRNKCWFSEEDDNCTNSPHAFSIVLKNQDQECLNRLKQALDKRKIEWKRNFGSMPAHGAFDYLEVGSFPNAEHCGNFGLHVGVHQYLSANDIEDIIECVTTTL